MYPVFVREFFNFLLITLGILSAGMGLKGFLFSSNFIDGGVTGVLIFVVAIAILGIEPALYSILTYITAARTQNFVKKSQTRLDME